MRWLKNTAGKPDACLTMAVVCLAVVLVKLLIAGVVIFGHQLGTAPDGGAIGALLAPTLGAYWARRHTDAITAGEKKDGEP